jgi:hypothetical protein
MNKKCEPNIKNFSNYWRIFFPLFDGRNMSDLRFLFFAAIFFSRDGLAGLSGHTVAVKVAVAGWQWYQWIEGVTGSILVVVWG